MKIIHTADWHLGNSLFNIDRTKELDSFFDWLKSTIEKEHAQVLIVSGDIFDTTNPPVSARAKYFKFLASLIDTECTNIIITGGNHDSANMIDAPADILSALNIHVVGSIVERSVEDMIFELKDKNSNIIGICAAVPYAREVDLRSYKTDCESDNFMENTHKELYRQIGEACNRIKNGRKIPVIAMGHLFANDLEGRYSSYDDLAKVDDGTRNIDITGNLGRISTEVFGSYYDYVALGHIHYTTKVAGHNEIRYSGSPFVLGFDESSRPHHVLAVDFDETNKPVVTKLVVPEFIRFKRVQGTVSEIKDALIELNKHEITEPLYVELYYDVVPGESIHAEIDTMLSDLKYKIVSWKPNYRHNASSNVMAEDLDIKEMNSIDEEFVFKHLILSKCGYDADSQEAKNILDEYLPLFNEIYGELD